MGCRHRLHTRHHLQTCTHTHTHTLVHMYMYMYKTHMVISPHTPVYINTCSTCNPFHYCKRRNNIRTCTCTCVHCCLHLSGSHEKCILNWHDMTSKNWVFKVKLDLFMATSYVNSPMKGVYLPMDYTTVSQYITHTRTHIHK